MSEERFLQHGGKHTRKEGRKERKEGLLLLPSLASQRAWERSAVNITSARHNEESQQQGLSHQINQTYIIYPEGSSSRAVRADGSFGFPDVTFKWIQRVQRSE